MTAIELRDQMLVERYGDVLREARAALAGATPWTPAEQRRHRAELDEEIRDHAAARP